MKVLKKILWLCLIILLLLNILIFTTDHTYLYKGIANTYLKGRKGPSIDEYLIFENREIKAGKHHTWNTIKSYNTKNISEKYLNDFDAYQTVAFLVIRDDSIAYEHYWDAYSANSITNSFSMAKSIVSILVGIAIDEGKIKSIDQPVKDFLPDFEKGMNSKLSIKHLLTMSSGINFDESYTSPFGFAAKAYYGDDLKKLLADYKVTSEPGEVFQYRSGNTILLGLILQKATGKHISNYTSEKLWIPLGAKNDAFWGLDNKDGLEKAYCCFNSNARDFARIGQLYLNKGKWNDKQIISEEYILQSIQPADLTEEDGTKNDRYGYSWWLINYRGNDIFYARGIQGQYIFVIPEKNMVIVRLGHQRAARTEWNRHPKDIFLYIDAALEMI